jgi:outer membrane protein
MKKVQLIINGVLVLAILGLYTLFFIGKFNKEDKKALSDTPASVKNSGVIAYVNFDTLTLKYELYREYTQNFETKARNSESELNSRAQTFQQAVADLQYKADKGLITRADAEERQQQLAMEQQEIMQLRDQMSANLAEEQQVMNRQIMDKIITYLSEFNKDGRYQFIFSTTFGGNILYATDSMDITNEVINGLNAQYKKEKGLQ